MPQQALLHAGVIDNKCPCATLRCISHCAFRIVCTIYVQTMSYVEAEMKAKATDCLNGTEDDSDHDHAILLRPAEEVALLCPSTELV